VQNGLIHVNGRGTLSLARTLSMLEVGGSITLFPSENGVSIVKGMLTKQMCFKVENQSLFEKYLLQMNRRNTCSSWHSTMCERQECLPPCLPLRIEFPVGRNTVYH
jgi:hypothetical protein